MDIEILRNVSLAVIASAVALIAGYTLTRIILGIFESLMDILKPGTWLAVVVIVLVIAALIVGYLLGAG